MAKIVIPVPNAKSENGKQLGIEFDTEGIESIDLSLRVNSGRVELWFTRKEDVPKWVEIDANSAT